MASFDQIGRGSSHDALPRPAGGTAVNRMRAPVVGLVFAVACVVAGALLTRHFTGAHSARVPAPPQQVAIAQADAAPMDAAPSSAPVSEPTAVSPPEALPSPSAPTSEPAPVVTAKKADGPTENNGPTAPANKRKQQPPPDAAGAEDPPLARQALALVGADPLAELVWVDAINDPDRTPHERQDLIEDLNEDGFPDPKHPTADDLPLIESRLALIEALAPDAMDDVNAAAFAEAYKDLVNMYDRVTSEQ